MRVCGFGIEISGQRVVLLADADVKKVGVVTGVFRCELDGPVERIDMVNECVQAVSITGPDEKYIIYVSPPNPGTAWSCC